jgi:hypothetical protein
MRDGDEDNIGRSRVPTSLGWSMLISKAEGCRDINATIVFLRLWRSTNFLEYASDIVGVDVGVQVPGKRSSFRFKIHWSLFFDFDTALPGA